MNLRTVLFGAFLLMQPFRLLSAQPATDGESFVIRGAWHNDDWYTDAYGQNPAPFYRNPFLEPPNRPPYPWRPNNTAIWGLDDALFPGKGGFQVILDTTKSPSVVSIAGRVPVNSVTTGDAPQVPLQATTASTGGSILPGAYLFAVAGSPNGPASQHFVAVQVPAGTSTNTVTISDVQWTAAAPAPAVFAGESSLVMRKILTWTGSSNDSFGNPTVFTITDIAVDGTGLPDVNFNSFTVQAKRIIHGGVFGAAPTSVGLSGGSKTATFAGASWTTNQWAGYVVSSYRASDAGGGPKNWIVLSNTGNKLTFVSGGFGPAVGEVIVMRAAAAHISSSTIGDDNFVNFYGAGMVVNAEAGNLVRIIAGTGSSQPPMTIKSNTATILTIMGTWYVTPDSSSVYIIEEPTWKYSKTTGAITNDNWSNSFVSGNASLSLVDFQFSSLLIMVLTADQSGRTSPETYAPIREIYVPATAIPGANGEYTVPAVNVATTLAVAITSTSATTATLASVAGLDANPFLLTVGTECIYCPSGASTSLTGLVRGYNGTTAATHLINAAVGVTTFTPDISQGVMQLIALTSHSTLKAPINTSGPAPFDMDQHQDATGGWALLPSAGYVSVDGTKFDQTPLNRYTVYFSIRATGDVNTTGSSGPYPI